MAKVNSVTTVVRKKGTALKADLRSSLSQQDEIDQFYEMDEFSITNKTNNAILEAYLEECEPLGCSVTALHNLRYSAKRKPQNIRVADLILFTADELDRLVAMASVSTKGGVADVVTIVVTTTSNQAVWESALATAKSFVAVKTFKNANTGNTVTIWMSNN